MPVDKEIRQMPSLKDEIKRISETAEEEAQRQADETKGQEILAQEQAQKDLKASAKAKLVAGEPLTEAEADTLVI